MLLKPIPVSLTFTEIAGVPCKSSDSEKIRKIFRRFALPQGMLATRVSVTLRHQGERRGVLEEPHEVAIDLDPLSLRCRLTASVPPPGFHLHITQEFSGSRSLESVERIFRPVKNRVAVGCIRCWATAFGPWLESQLAICTTVSPNICLPFTV